MNGADPLCPSHAADGRSEVRPCRCWTTPGSCSDAVGRAVSQPAGSDDGTWTSWRSPHRFPRPRGRSSRRWTPPSAPSPGGHGEAVCAAAAPAPSSARADFAEDLMVTTGPTGHDRCGRQGPGGRRPPVGDGPVTSTPAPGDKPSTVPGSRTPVRTPDLHTHVGASSPAAPPAVGATEGWRSSRRSRRSREERCASSRSRRPSRWTGRSRGSTTGSTLRRGAEPGTPTSWQRWSVSTPRPTHSPCALFPPNVSRRTSPRPRSSCSTRAPAGVTLLRQAPGRRAGCSPTARPGPRQHHFVVTDRSCGRPGETRSVRTGWPSRNLARHPRGRPARRDP